MAEILSALMVKRCPFCGKKPLVRKGNRFKADQGGICPHKAGDWWWKPSVACRPCDIKFEADSLEAALDRWNARKG